MGEVVRLIRGSGACGFPFVFVWEGGIGKTDVKDSGGGGADHVHL